MSEQIDIKVREIVLDVERRKSSGDRSPSLARVGDRLGVGVYQDAITDELGLKVPRVRHYRVRWYLDPAGDLRVYSGGVSRISGDWGSYPLCIFPREWHGERVSREVLPRRCSRRRA